MEELQQFILFPNILAENLSFHSIFKITLLFTLLLRITQIQHMTYTLNIFIYNHL